MPRIAKETTTSSVNHLTGEVLQTQKIEEKYIESEPAFVKVYIEDICMLNRVPKSHQDVLFFLIRKLDFEGYITLSSRYRSEICDKLSIKAQTLSNKLQGLCRSGLIKRSGTNEFLANPHFFARGAWVEILKRRQKGDFSLTINYKNNGQRTFEVSTNQIKTEDISQ